MCFFVGILFLSADSWLTINNIDNSLNTVRNTINNQASRRDLYHFVERIWVCRRDEAVFSCSKKKNFERKNVTLFNSVELLFFSTQNIILATTLTILMHFAKRISESKHRTDEINNHKTTQNKLQPNKCEFLSHQFFFFYAMHFVENICT